MIRWGGGKQRSNDCQRPFESESKRQEYDSSSQAENCFECVDEQEKSQEEYGSSNDNNVGSILVEISLSIINPINFVKSVVMIPDMPPCSN